MKEKINRPFNRAREFSLLGVALVILAIIQMGTSIIGDSYDIRVWSFMAAYFLIILGIFFIFKPGHYKILMGPDDNQNLT